LTFRSQFKDAFLNHSANVTLGRDCFTYVADSLQRANRCCSAENEEVAVVVFETGFSAVHQTCDAIDGFDLTAVVIAVYRPFERIARSVI